MAPAGYILDTTPIPISLPAGEDVTENVANTPIPLGSITVFKYIDGTRTPLEGAQFMLEVFNNDTQQYEFVSRGNTAADGTFKWNSLPAGRYRLTETVAPAGYILDTTPIPVSLPEGADVTENVANTPVPLGSITVFKHIDGTRTPLEGAQFMLEVYNNDTQQYEFVSRGNTAADGTFKWSSLPAGRYRLTETVAPTGYILDTTPIPVSLPEGADVTENVANTPLGSITVFKHIDGTRTPLEGAQFMLEVYNNDTQQYEFISRGNTAADGTFKWSSLPAGRYRLTETVAPAGYILDTTPIPISLPAGEDVTENVANTPLGSITVFKHIDGTSTPLEGAQFA